MSIPQQSLQRHHSPCIDAESVMNHCSREESQSSQSNKVHHSGCMYKWSHGDLHRQTPCGKGPIPSASCQQITSIVTSQEQGDPAGKPRVYSQRSTDTLTPPGEVKTRQLPHKEMKAHVCKWCDRSFDRPSQLERHQRTHTGETPYICKQCEKSFTHLKTW